MPLGRARAGLTGVLPSRPRPRPSRSSPSHSRPIICMSGAMGAPPMGICFGSQQRFVKQHPHMHATQPGPPQPSWPTTAHTGQQNLYKAPGGSLYCTHWSRAGHDVLAGSGRRGLRGRFGSGEYVGICRRGPERDRERPPCFLRGLELSGRQERARSARDGLFGRSRDTLTFPLNASKSIPFGMASSPRALTTDPVAKPNSFA